MSKITAPCLFGGDVVVRNPPAPDCQRKTAADKLIDTYRKCVDPERSCKTCESVTAKPDPYNAGNTLYRCKKIDTIDALATAVTPDGLCDSHRHRSAGRK